MGKYARRSLFPNTNFVSAALEVLRRDDLTQEQRQEIAGAFSARGISFDVEISIEHEP